MTECKRCFDHENTPALGPYWDVDNAHYQAHSEAIEQVTSIRAELADKSRKLEAMDTRITEEWSRRLEAEAELAEERRKREEAEGAIQKATEMFRSKFPEEYAEIAKRITADTSPNLGEQLPEFVWKAKCEQQTALYEAAREVAWMACHHNNCFQHPCMCPSKVDAEIAAKLAEKVKP
jgi:hypothetical protein